MHARFGPGPHGWSKVVEAVEIPGVAKNAENRAVKPMKKYCVCVFEHSILLYALFALYCT